MLFLIKHKKNKIKSGICKYLLVCIRIRIQRLSGLAKTKIKQVKKMLFR